MLNPSELTHVNIIGSDDYERAVLGLVLGAREYRVRSFSSLDDFGLPRPEAGGTCALLALSRREVETGAILQQIRQLSLHMPVLLLVDQVCYPQLAAALESDHISLLIRPVQKDVLLRSIRQAIRCWLESEIT
ncbi:response regulator transcription factor [Undibacterium curvum]|jgi:DNA-binding NtrC family response regulator|uniref:Response regulatory domain-containing protein n=1 Tax=Undibacterium curvum TaxID=2762294 RepID=A0ABR7A422_9BURK|nr:hypothetical protein [Undibacterium curvum]MBC3931584.1 hypothetical protein [Undibacterium curvum]